MKLVLMKYLNNKNIPCYRYITEGEIPGDDKNRLGMMEIEAAEMLYTGDMKEKLWVKSLNEDEYKQLMCGESDARIKKLDKLNEVREKVLENS